MILLTTRVGSSTLIVRFIPQWFLVFALLSFHSQTITRVPETVIKAQWVSRQWESMQATTNWEWTLLHTASIILRNLLWWQGLLIFFILKSCLLDAMQSLQLLAILDTIMKIQWSSISMLSIEASFDQFSLEPIQINVSLKIRRSLRSQIDQWLEESMVTTLS